MEKRALLAFALSLLVLFGYQYLFLSKTQEQGVRPPAEENRTPETTAESVFESEKRPDKAVSWEAQGIKETKTVSEQIVLVETDLARYRISTRDAAIKEIVLRNYREESGEPVRLVGEETEYYPLQVMMQEKPLGLSFSPSHKEIRITGKETATLKMIYTGSDGARITKLLDFTGDSYKVGVKIEQNILSDYQLLVGSHFRGSDQKEKGGYRSHSGPVIDFQGEIERIKYKKITERKIFSGDIAWIALEEKYFMTALLPEGPGVGAAADQLNTPQGSHVVYGLTADEQGLSCFFYAGPKDYEILKSFGKGLERVINFGVFGFLAKPMFYLLKFIHQILGNYGVAIIILTTIIKFIFWPLTHKQQKSMKEMQKIQPEMSALREKYKSDPQRMNKEVMGLYKKHKVNPAAGCLPLVIQIPVFFALYNVLLSAIELRGAPFLYIHDLSAADTLFGHIAGFSVGPLPLLMGVSMYYQQKMMPTTMDPKQAKIFQLMPVIFTFMFLNFPSGLVLYWLVNNVLTIVQQYYINKKKGAVTA